MNAIAKIFSTMIELSLTCGAAALVLLLLSARLNRTFVAKWKYWVWLLLAARLLVPINFTFPFSSVRLSAPTLMLPPLSPFSPAAPMAAPVPQNAPDARAASAMTLVQVAALIWLAGVFAFLLYQFVVYQLYQNRCLRHSHPLYSADLAGLLPRLCLEMGIRRTVCARVCDWIASPMIIGFFKCRLLIPTEDYTETEAVFILRHELVHLKRYDIWYKLILLLANAAHWFNPVIYLMVREAGKDLELACDDEVVRGLSLEGCKQYSETILSGLHRQITGRTTLTTRFTSGPRIIKERFWNIFNARRKRRGFVPCVLVLLCTALAGGLVACNVGADSDLSGASSGASIFTAPVQQKITGDINLADTAWLTSRFMAGPFIATILGDSWDDPTAISSEKFVDFYADAWMRVNGRQNSDQMIFSEEELESYVRSCFDVPVEMIRDNVRYDRENHTYLCTGLGGAADGKVIRAEQSGEELRLDYEVYSPSDGTTVIWEGTLTLNVSGGRYQYTANVTRNAKFPITESQERLDELSQRYVWPLIQTGGILISPWQSPDEIAADELINFCAYNNLLNLPTRPDANGENRPIAQGGEYVAQIGPQESVEKAIQQYFDITADALRTSSLYQYESDKQYENAYMLPDGFGGGGSTRALAVSQEGDLLVITVGVFGPDDEMDRPSMIGLLTIRQNGDRFQYLSYQTNP